MKTKLFLLLLIITIAASLSAQEKLTMEEMFRWFPKVKFDEIRHYNLQIASKQKGFESFLKDEEKTLADWYLDVEFPDELADKLTSVTTMTTVRIVAYTGKQRPFGRGGKVAVGIIGDTEYLSNSFGTKMTVLRPDENINLPKLLPTLKSVKKTGAFFKELPLYLFETKYLKKQAITLHMWVSPEQELLLCEDLAILKKMVAAGTGEIPDVLTDFPFPNLFDCITDLGPCWTFMSWKPSLRAIWAQAEKDGLDQELINQKRDTSEMKGDDLEDYIYDLPVKRRNMSLFENDQAAETALIKQKAWRAKYRYKESFQDVKDRFVSLRRENNLVVTTILLSPEYRKADAEFYKYLDEKRKERQAKEKAKRSDDNNQDSNTEEK